MNQCVAGRAQLRPKSDERVGVTQLECRRHGVSAPLDATSHLYEENAEKPTKGRILRILVDPQCGRLRGELCGRQVRTLICNHAGEVAFEKPTKQVVVGPGGLEPPTHGLKVRCSTIEL